MKSWSTTMIGDKPRYQRKPRKDGSTRKARVFGRPWWYEKAGWSEEKCDERRAVILNRLKEKWSDWYAFKNDAASSQEVQDWIRPLVVTFDDTSWCLPTSSDPQKRLNEQLSIYSEWAKVIFRDTARIHKNRQSPDQNTILRSPQSIATSMKLLGYPGSSRHTSFTPVNRSQSYGRDGGLLQRWRQTRAIDGVPEKDAAAVDGRPEIDALALTWNISRPGDPGAQNVEGSRHQSDHGSKAWSFTTPTNIEENAVSGIPDDFSDDDDDDDTEITEVSDSEPARQTSSKIKPAAGGSKNGNARNKSRQKWQDIDWDDVVVTIDATEWIGEYFPIPMTMLKPGSSRSLCRWDDFELHDLYARLEVEAGQKIDWTKYMIVSMVNSKHIAINTPGKYKLMLKEFTEKTPRSSAMALFLRIVERTISTETIRHGPPQQNRLFEQSKRNEKRSQFTGAPSDFSSDTETESTQPPLKRQKHDNISELMSPSRSRPNIGGPSDAPGDLPDEQSQEAAVVSIDKPGEELKLRQSPDEFTQDSNALI